MDIFEDRTKRINMAYNKEALKKSRELSKLNISDLRENATNSGISVENDGKFLKKQALVDNLLENFMEYSS